MIPSGFIEVTCLDGLKSLVRTESIFAVHQYNAKVGDDGAVHPSCRSIEYSGDHLYVQEDYEELCDMIYKAEL